MLVSLMFSQRYLILYTFFCILFSCCFSWIISTTLSQRLLLCSASPHLLLSSSSALLLSVIVFFSLILLFHICYPFVEVLTEFIHFFLSLMSIFMTITLISLTGKLLISDFGYTTVSIFFHFESTPFHLILPNPLCFYALKCQQSLHKLKSDTFTILSFPIYNSEHLIYLRLLSFS